MPGTTVVQGQTASTEVIKRALDNVCFRDEYEVTTHVETDAALLASTSYPEYPVKTVETMDAVFVLEGYLYDVDDEWEQIRSIGPELLDKRFSEIREWLINRDGDFLLTAYEKETGAVSVVSDIFARLPVYYTTIGDDIVLSRELKFIRDLAASCNEPLESDVLAFAQTLLFGYQLGDQTLFESVHRVPPGAYVHIDGNVQVERLHTHDFGTTAHADRSVRENARSLAYRFKDACENRDVDGLPNVLSLSGGLDSRAAAGGYTGADISYTAATFKKSNGGNDADVRFAKRISEALGVDWERYTVERTETHQDELLAMKQGQNFLAMAFICDFLEQLRSRHDAFTYVTGDGGDKALPDLTPSRTFNSERELAEYIVDVHSIFNRTEAASLTNVTSERLIQTVEERLDSYPESDHDAQYVHFLIRERGINWLNHGEDRNRYYCWSVSPFYAPQFFTYAMNVPAHQKYQNRLYAAFLAELDPALCEIKDANFNASITSLQHKVKQFGINLITRYPAVKNTISSVLKNGGNEDLSAVIKREFQQADEVPFDKTAVTNVIRNHEQYDGHEMYNMITLLRTINYDTDLVTQSRPKSVVPDRNS